MQINEPHVENQQSICNPPNTEVKNEEPKRLLGLELEHAMPLLEPGPKFFCLGLQARTKLEFFFFKIPAQARA